MLRANEHRTVPVSNGERATAAIRLRRRRQCDDKGKGQRRAVRACRASLP